MNYVETWIIEGLETRPQVFGFAQVVSQVNWRLEIQHQGLTWSHSAQTRLGFPGDDFCSFDQLTAEQVMAWVQEVLGPERLYQLRAEAYNWLARQSGSTVTTVTSFPWSVGV